MVAFSHIQATDMYSHPDYQPRQWNPESLPMNFPSNPHYDDDGNELPF